jgi:hypothetical protein
LRQANSCGCSRKSTFWDGLTVRLQPQNPSWSPAAPRKFRGATEEPEAWPAIRRMVSRGDKTAADAARLFRIHPATVCRLLARPPAPNRQEDQTCQIMLTELCQIILKVTLQSSTIVRIAACAILQLMAKFLRVAMLCVALSAEVFASAIAVIERPSSS